MAVDLISPTSSVVNSTSVLFEWNSDDGSYCYDNYVNLLDEGGNTVSSSGNFNPNGGNSIFEFNNLPLNVSFTADVSCNPNNTLRFDFQTSTTPVSSEPLTGGEIVINTEQLELMLTAFDQDTFAFVLTAMFFAMSLGLGGGWLYKAIRTR